MNEKDYFVLFFFVGFVLEEGVVGFVVECVM